jgi:hypothetical protein
MKTNMALRKLADKWAQDNVHPASDQNRIWASEGFISGMEYKAAVTEEARHEIHSEGFEAGKMFAYEDAAKLAEHAVKEERLNGFATTPITMALALLPTAIRNKAQVLAKTLPHKKGPE